MNCGNMTGVAFIDLRKAFDTVNHDILIRKLHELGVSYSALKWFKSYLSCRSQKVCLRIAYQNHLRYQQEYLKAVSLVLSFSLFSLTV